MIVSSQDRRRILQAIKKAGESDYKYKHGAIIFRGGSVVGSAANKVKNSGRIVDHDHTTVHAEEGAIRAAGALKGATIYVGRLHKNGEFASSKPCSRCLTSIMLAGIEKVVWTENQNVQAARLRDIMNSDGVQ